MQYINLPENPVGQLQIKSRPFKIKHTPPLQQIFIPAGQGAINGIVVGDAVVVVVVVVVTAVGATVPEVESSHNVP